MQFLDEDLNQIIVFNSRQFFPYLQETAVFFTFLSKYVLQKIWCNKVTDLISCAQVIKRAQSTKINNKRRFLLIYLLSFLIKIGKFLIFPLNPSVINRQRSNFTNIVNWRKTILIEKLIFFTFDWLPIMQKVDVPQKGTPLDFGQDLKKKF